MQSSLGTGTRFDIWLPCAPPVELAPVKRRRPNGRGCGETVLVLETDRERLLRHEEILGPSVTNRWASRSWPKRWRPAAGRKRGSMPRWCALSTGPRPRSTLAAAVHKVAPSLPIILAAASSGDFDAPSLAAAGISELIHHPLSSAELAGALTRCLAMPVPSFRHDRSPAAVVDGRAMTAIVAIAI